MRVFVTGLTGTLGTALAKLHHSRGDQVWGCSRSESTAVEWLKQNAKIATLFLCDVMDLGWATDDASRLLPSMDKIYHCAAMKHVDLCERQPGEAIRQNVVLVERIAAAAAKCSRDGVLTFISSDKACLPQGVYGATKLLAEKLAIRHGAAVVRLGNLIGSSGSVFAHWKNSAENFHTIKLTDPEMTRYFMGIKQAAEFVASLAPVSGKVVIPHPLKSVRMGDVATEVAKRFCIRKDNLIITGPRPGESQHQWLIAPSEGIEEEINTITLGGRFVEHRGWSSEDALRWDVGELLTLAGIK